MKPFAIDRHGRLALPSHFFPAIDFSALDSVEHLTSLVQRDFDSKGPSGAELLRRLESGAYRNRYELLRDLALHLFWVNRFSLTLYEQRPCCWRHVPKKRDDVFIPTIAPWKDAQRKIAAVQTAFDALPSAWSAEAEYRIFARLFDIFRNRRYQAAVLPPLLPTVAESHPPHRGRQDPRRRCGDGAHAANARSARVHPPGESWSAAFSACAGAEAVPCPAASRPGGECAPPFQHPSALRGARQRQGRDRLHQSRSAAQRGLHLVTDVGGRHSGEDRHRDALLHRALAR